MLVGMGRFSCLCGERPIPPLPRHEWHAPLGSHLLEAKCFAGWHGFVENVKAEREEVKRINDKIKSAVG